MWKCENPRYEKHSSDTRKWDRSFRNGNRPSSTTVLTEEIRIPTRTINKLGSAGSNRTFALSLCATVLTFLSLVATALPISSVVSFRKPYSSYSYTRDNRFYRRMLLSFIINRHRLLLISNQEVWSKFRIISNATRYRLHNTQLTDNGDSLLSICNFRFTQY